PDAHLDPPVERRENFLAIIDVPMIRRVGPVQARGDAAHIGDVEGAPRAGRAELLAPDDLDGRCLHVRLTVSMGTRPGPFQALLHVGTVDGCHAALLVRAIVGNILRYRPPRYPRPPDELCERTRRMPLDEFGPVHRPTVM